MENRQPGRTRLIALAALAAGLIGFMLWIGWRDLTLLVGNRTASARIVKVETGAHDFTLFYIYKDEDGIVHSGQDTLPLAEQPGATRTVPIAYSTHRPDVSRIRSQVSFTPIAGIAMGAFYLVVAAIQLIRRSAGGSSPQPIVPFEPTGDQAIHPATPSGASRRSMQCPACGEQAIPFAAWGHGINAFRTQCMHCGTKLKANRTVIAGFAMCLLSMLLVMVLIIALAPERIQGICVSIGIIATAIISAWVVYRVGGYTRL